MFSKRLEKALRFATLAHDGQRRKGSPLPYIYHPVSVGMILLRFGFPEDWILAGILHDTIEDTETSPQDLVQAFGPEVAALVEGCSEPEQATRSWEDRKGHTIQFLRTAPYPVKVIACADKLHNLGSMHFDIEHEPGDDEEIWGRYRRGREQQAWYYQGVARSLVENLDGGERHEIFEHLERMVHDVFGEGR